MFNKSTYDFLLQGNARKFYVKKKSAAIKELKTIESQSVAMKSAEKKTKQVSILSTTIYWSEKLDNFIIYWSKKLDYFTINLSEMLDYFITFKSVQPLLILPSKFYSSDVEGSCCDRSCHEGA